MQRASATTRAPSLVAMLAAMHEPAAERPAWLAAAYLDPSAFWQRVAPLLVAQAPGASRSALFQWYSLFDEFGRRHAVGSRLALAVQGAAGRMETHSYAALADRAESLALLWLDTGVGPGATVCVVSDVSFWYLSCILAAWHLGASVTVLPPAGPSFVTGALTALVEHRKEAEAQAESPLVFVAPGATAKPWLSPDFGDRMLGTGFGSTPTKRGSRPPHRFAAHEIAARFFSPLSDDWEHPVALSAEQLYFGALRDGLLVFGLGPGARLAAPGFCEVQFKPTLVLAALAAGATWVEVPEEELPRGKTLTELKLDVLGVSPAIRDALLKMSALPGSFPRRWFRNVAEGPSASPWMALNRRLEAAELHGMQCLANAAAAGTILFSPWSKRPETVGVWRSPGLPCELQEPNGTGMPALADVAMMAPATKLEGSVGVSDGLPDNALGRLVIGTGEPYDVWVTNLGSHREGKVLSEKQMEALLKATFPRAVRAAVLVSLPVRAHAARTRAALLVFTYPKAAESLPAELLAAHLRAELGPSWAPDLIELFALSPKLTDPKGKELTIDRAGCAAQYISGTLWRKGRCEVFSALAELSAEAEEMRQHAPMTKQPEP